MNRTLALAGSLSLSVAAATSVAADWLQFRGPQGAGSAGDANLPIVLDAGKSVAWKGDLPGRGLSSPTIIGDRLVVTCASGPQLDRLHLLCLSTTNGTRRWERQFWATGRTTTHEKISAAAPSPTSDGERIFALFSSTDLFAVDLDGNLLWLRGLMRDYPNASNALGLSSSPVVADGVVVVQIETDGDAFVVGIDAKTGLNRWKIERRKRANWSSPLVLNAADGKHLVAVQSSTGVTALDPATGTEVWSYKDGASTVPSSTVSGETIFVPSFGITALVPQASGQPPRQLWRASQLRPATASPVVVGDHLFTLNDAGVLTCAATATGDRVWQLRLKGPFSASPIAAGKHLYLVNEEGLVQVVNVEKPGGEIVSELPLGEAVIGTPSVGENGLYVRSDQHLWRLAGPPRTAVQ
jgi:outer membrane protein assembly factor BamB